MRLMTFAETLQALDERKGDGSWREIARRAGLHYDTVARIARGGMKNPGVKVVEAIGLAIDAIDAEKAKAEPA